MTDLGKVYGRTAAQFAADAVRLAAADAGLALGDLDGLLVSSGVTGGVDLICSVDLGLHDLGLLSEMQAYGSTAGAMVQVASMAVMSGMATTVACVWADAPLRQGVSGSAAYGARRRVPAGWRGLTAAAGIVSPNQLYALAARRHMDRYGTTSDQLGAIAVAQRDWAALNPLAQLRDPITLDGLPLVAVDRRAVPPARLLPGLQRRHRGHRHHRGPGGRPAAAAGIGARLGAGASRSLRAPLRRLRARHRGRHRRARGAARWPASSLADIDVVELYDCYTYTVLVTLEDYGFCAKGEGGPFAASGVLGPGRGR